MLKRFLKGLFFILITIISLSLLSCSSLNFKDSVTKPVKFLSKAVPKVSLVKFNWKKEKKEPVQNVDNLLIILDASESMNEPYARKAKIEHARKILSNLKKGIADLKIVSAVRTFTDHPKDETPKQTNLLMGLSEYSDKAFGTFLKTAKIFPKSTMALAIEASTEDLHYTAGNIAVIIISDGKTYDDTPLTATMKMKEKFGSKLAVFPILVGRDSSGRKLMKKLAKIGGGFYKKGKCLAKGSCMPKYISSVFFTEREEGQGQKLISSKGDTDGDGVDNAIDMCPETLSDVDVDEKGCPIDTDGDGVFDYLDQCPDTLAGMKVNSSGCASSREIPSSVIESSLNKLRSQLGDEDYMVSDSDRDGVPDKVDQCYGTPLGARVNKHGCWIIEGKVFNEASWKVSPNYFSYIDDVVNIMKQNPSLRLKIQGNTDYRGSEANNKTLSVMRAKEIKKYLVRKGIASNRLSVYGY